MWTPHHSGFSITIIMSQWCSVQRYISTDPASDVAVCGEVEEGDGECSQVDPEVVAQNDDEYPSGPALFVNLQRAIPRPSND